MVEQYIQLDTVFSALSDPIRRDILRRVTREELSVGSLAESYDVSFAAVSKHLKVLEAAQLVTKRKDGRASMVSLKAETLKEADAYLEQYRQMWEGRFKKLDSLLKQ